MNPGCREVLDHDAFTAPVELIELGVQHKLITLPRLYAPVHGRPREQVQA